MYDNPIKHIINKIGFILNPFFSIVTAVTWSEIVANKQGIFP